MGNFVKTENIYEILASIFLVCSRFHNQFRASRTKSCENPLSLWDIDHGSDIFVFAQVESSTDHIIEIFYHLRLISNMNSIGQEIL